MALLLPKQKAIFLHCPKTGGLFVENFLRETTQVQWLGNRHSHMRMIGKIAYDPNYFKFCFIRKPSEWYQSYWQMKMGETQLHVKSSDHWYMLGVGQDRGGIHQLHHPTWDIDPCCGSNDLNVFVDNCLLLNGFLNRLYENFIGWGFAKSNFVGDFENFINHFEVILDHLKIQYDKKRLENKPKYNPSVKRQAIDQGLELAINDLEYFYFKQKKGFQ